MYVCVCVCVCMCVVLDGVGERGDIFRFIFQIDRSGSPGSNGSEEGKNGCLKTF